MLAVDSSFDVVDVTEEDVIDLVDGTSEEEGLEAAGANPRLTVLLLTINCPVVKFPKTEVAAGVVQVLSRYCYWWSGTTLLLAL